MTRPDFAYSKNQALIYIDGPHHKADPHKQLDKKITATLEDAGFTVIRFPQEQIPWPSVVSKFPDIFGTGRASITPG